MGRRQTYHAFRCSSQESVLRIANQARSSGLFAAVFDERSVVIGPINLVRGSKWDKLIRRETTEIYSSDFPAGAKAILRSRAPEVAAA
jgi:hypothetical protein